MLASGARVALVRFVDPFDPALLPVAPIGGPVPSPARHL